MTDSYSITKTNPNQYNYTAQKAAKSTVPNSVIEEGLNAENKDSQTQKPITTKEEVHSLIVEEFSKLKLDKKNENFIKSIKNIDKLLQSFTSEYKKVEDLLKLSPENIRNVIDEVVKKTKIAINTGWSLNGICSHNNNKRGLLEYLKQFNVPQEIKNCKNDTELAELANNNPQVLKDAIKVAFNDFFKNKDNKQKNGKRHDEIVKLQLQTFGRMLVNSSPEEQILFTEVVKQLLSENKVPGAKELIDAIESEDSKQIVIKNLMDDAQETINSVDECGNTMTPEQTEAYIRLLTQYCNNSETIREFHSKNDEAFSKFLAENEDELNLIKHKLENEIPLTTEEQELLDELDRRKSVAGGEIEGCAINTNIAESDRDQILTEMNDDLYKHGSEIYSEVIKEVGNYIEEHHEEINMSKEDFEKLMDKVTNGNYTKIQNGETDNLTPPNSTQQYTPPRNSETHSSSTNTDTSNNQVSTTEQDVTGRCGFTQSVATQPEQNIKPADLYTPVNETPVLVSNANFENFITQNGNNLGVINNYIQKFGIRKFATNTLNTASSKNTLAFDKAIIGLSRMGSSLKKLTYEGIHVTSNAIIAAREALSTNELADVNAQNIYVAKKIEDIKEDKKRQLGNINMGLS